MRRLFVDTFYLIALSHHRDRWHERVMSFSRDLVDCRLYTVDEVLAEYLTACSGSGSRIRAQAAHMVKQALDSPEWTVIPQTRSSLLNALTLYESRPDKEYSLVDCVAMQAMRREGLMEILSNDHHFTQEGFQIVFG